jgi:transcriptional regulator of acetoin/glycerol metabolism
MHASHFLTCSAAPIRDPCGTILDLLDVTGDHRSFHQHRMALVKISARMIENHLRTDDYRTLVRRRFHSRVEFIGTPMEGIPAVAAAVAPAHASARSPERPAPQRSLEEMDIEAIHHAVAAAGHISEASKPLGISRNAIDRKLRWNKAG